MPITDVTAPLATAPAPSPIVKEATSLTTSASTGLKFPGGENFREITFAANRENGPNVQSTQRNIDLDVLTGQIAKSIQASLSTGKPINPNADEFRNLIACSGKPFEMTFLTDKLKDALLNNRSPEAYYQNYHQAVGTSVRSLNLPESTTPGAPSVNGFLVAAIHRLDITKLLNEKYGLNGLGITDKEGNKISPRFDIVFGTNGEHALVCLMPKKDAAGNVTLVMEKPAPEANVLAAKMIANPNIFTVATPSSATDRAEAITTIPMAERNAIFTLAMELSPTAGGSILGVGVTADEARIMNEVASSPESWRERNERITNEERLAAYHARMELEAQQESQVSATGKGGSFGQGTKKVVSGAAQAVGGFFKGLFR